MIHFVTFANEKLSATRKRIIKEAVESEFFNEIHEFNESALNHRNLIDDSFSTNHPDFITSRYRII